MKLINIYLKISMFLQILSLITRKDFVLLFLSDLFTQFKEMKIDKIWRFDFNSFITNLCTHTHTHTHIYIYQKKVTLSKTW